MTDTLRRVAVVGASLAGLRSVEALRRQGFDGTLTLVGEEPRLPYDRPPLTKEVLRGEREPETLTFRDATALAELGLELELGRRATALNVRARHVLLDDGRRLRYDGLVIATGSRPVRLPVPGADLPGVTTLRTFDDAVTARDCMAGGARVVVVGAGFIGSEVAAAVRSRGLPVTVVEALAAPAVRALGHQLGSVVARMHADAGVDLRCGRAVVAFEGHRRVERVCLDDGGRVPADLVIVGVGARPAVDWLAGSGLPLGDGLRCGARLDAGPRVVAAGDITNWPHPLFGRRLRVEHWTNAAEQAAAAARTLLNPQTREAYAGIPFVWSDLYGSRLQMVGVPGDGVAVVRHGGYEQGRLVALFGQDGLLCGAAALNWPRPLMHYRRLIASGASWDDALAGEAPGL